MEDTESGIVNEVRLEHFSNALFPMVVTELEIVNEVRRKQSKNAPSQITVTVSGIV